MSLLFAGLAGYFFYDWKIGYPKKNYKLVQYNTFYKAKEYFLKHVEMGRTPEQWKEFVSEQELEYNKVTDIVLTHRSREKYPAILQDYEAYKQAYDAHSGDSPVLWDRYLAEKKKEIEDVKATFSDPPNKEDRAKLKGRAPWDEPVLAEYKKGEEEQNYILLMKNTFKEAEEKFKAYQSAGKTADDWKFFTSNRDLAFEREKGIIPLKNIGEKWPEMLGNYEEYYKQAEKEITEKIVVNKPYMWSDYTAKKKWGDKDYTGKEMKGQDKINEQLYFGIGVSILSLITALLAFRMKGRFMAVDEEAFYAPGNKKIPYSSITKIDKRKWETKGMATLYYDEGGEKKKAKVDGMIYGQFDKDAEGGGPAEELFQKILGNFKGEIVELVAEEEEEETSTDEG